MVDRAWREEIREAIPAVTGSLADGGRAIPKVLVTRARHQADEFGAALRRLGLEPIFLPTIEVTGPESWEACDRAIAQLPIYTDLIFTSANGVRFFLDRCQRFLDVGVLAEKTCHAVGLKTRQALESYGLSVRALPEQATARHLAEQLASDPQSAQKRFLFPHGDLSDDAWVHELMARGLTIDPVIVYRTVKADVAPEDRDAVGQMLDRGEIAVVSFFSPSAVKHFLDLFPDFACSPTARVAVIGDTTARACQAAGLTVSIRAGKTGDQATAEALARSIWNALTGWPSVEVGEGSLRQPNDLFLRACRRQPTERTPIWLMRQAGRYLPAYRTVRQKYDFLTMCRTPEIAAEVTLQPVTDLGVDAAILFSDILVVAEAMGLTLTIEENHGPRIETPLRSAHDIEALAIPDPTEKLGYVLDALRLTKRTLDGRVPLIGFAGAPWTLLAYMIEGVGTKDFLRARTFLYAEPRLAHAALEKIAQTVATFLLAQIEAGADALQLFDTWAGMLTHDQWREFACAANRQVIENIKAAVGERVPVILFSKGTGGWIEEMLTTGCDVLSLDWTMDLGHARARVRDRAALQGNLDPVALLAPPERLQEEARKVLDQFGAGHGHIFNLGHGVLPVTPAENVRLLVETVRAESPKYHHSRRSEDESSIAGEAKGNPLSER